MDHASNLTSLNDAQKEAVLCKDRSILVIAGAGSGKTKVLTTRIAWLVATQKICKEQIMAVTFTNKAAKEMAARINAMVNNAANSIAGMWIGTFHSIALRILTRHLQEAHIGNSYHILDNQEQSSLIKRVIKELSLDEDCYVLKDLQRYINNHKENGRRANSCCANNFKEERYLSIYSKYEDICRQENLLDFTELLLRCYELLCNHKHVLMQYQTQFLHIMVDEFQDTNSLQYRWLKLLATKNTHVFAVGDDDQSIYSFRGAMASNLQLFIQDFKVKKIIRLEQNYRSTTNILKAANAIIGNNSNRLGKELWTANTQGEAIRFYEAYTEDDEAYFVSDEIMNLLTTGYTPSDIAILYRSNAQSRLLEKHLYAKNIPYAIFGGLRFFERQEIKHVFAYLRLINNHHDNNAFLRAVNIPARGIGARTIANLQLLANESQQSLYSVSAKYEGRSHSSLHQFIALINKMTLDASNLSLADLVDYVIHESGLFDYYTHDKKGANNQERLANLNELINAAHGYSQNNNARAIQSFLSHAQLETEDNLQSNVNHHNKQGVQLMTVHAAKGLEFKAVFVVGLEDGLFPHENSLQDLQGLEEERRLIYVAITRAKELLYLLRACSRIGWGKREEKSLSRFVQEIPSAIINNISELSELGVNYSSRQQNVHECEQVANHSSIHGDEYNQELHNQCVQNSEQQGFRAAPKQLPRNPHNRISRVKIENKSMHLKIGDNIKHQRFGTGKVLELNVNGNKLTAKISFADVGKKTLDLNIANIEKL